MKRGATVWLFIPKNSEGSKRELKYGQYINKIDDHYIISSGRKIYKRKITEIAEVSEKEKILLTTLSK